MRLISLSLILFLLIFSSGCSGCGVKLNGGNPPQDFVPIELFTDLTFDYKGDPYLRIPNMMYQTSFVFINGFDNFAGKPFGGPTQTSLPVLPLTLSQEKRLRNILRTRDDASQMAIEISVEGLSNLDAARYLLTAHDLPDFVRSEDAYLYAHRYAHKAVEENPDDFSTLYVWLVVSQYRRSVELSMFHTLLKLKPQAIEVLRTLGFHLHRLYLNETGRTQKRNTLTAATDFLNKEQLKKIYEELAGTSPLSRKILPYEHRQHHFLNDLSQLIQKRTE